jgi:DNA adenine methylase
VSEIIELFPKFKEYREPMVGGGSIFLSTKFAYPKKKYWINDINHDIYSFWQASKETPELLASEAEKVKSSKKSGKEIFYEWRYPNIPLTDFELALRYFILNRISFSGLVDAGGFSKESFEYRFTKSSIEKIIYSGKQLENVKISNLSYETLLREKGNDVFIYLDPPYYGNKSSKLYGLRGYLHTTFNHKKLAEELESCKFNWLLTYDDHEIIRKYYSFANKIEKELSYGMNNVASNKATKGKELFISNYIPSKQKELKLRIES